MKELILIIEDDESIRSNLFEFLEAEDFNVLSAEDGVSGLKLAKDCQPDLILCDINLPSLNGFGVLQELRKDLTTTKTPFIFLTSETDSSSRDRAIQLGANDYLTKPMSLNKLLTSITHQCQLVGDTVKEQAKNSMLRELVMR